MGGHGHGYLAFRCQGLASGMSHLLDRSPSEKSITDEQPCQTYLSESEDDGSYGNVALGRSFALEMGSFIPPSDRRLGEFLYFHRYIYHIGSNSLRIRVY